MTTIRSMTPADYPAVAAIAADAAHGALVGRPAWESVNDVAAEIAALDNREFIVAEDGSGVIVGVAGYALNGEGEAAVYGPLVAVEGHGIGAWLAGRVEAMARQHGAEACSMLIGLGNRSGSAWAEWRGYQRDQEHPELLLMWVHPGELVEVRPEVGGIVAVRPVAAPVVRPAHDGDLDVIVALTQDCFPTQRISQEEWAALLPTCLVAELNGEVRGMIRLDAAAASLHDLCVAQDARHHGLGKALVAASVRQFWAQRPGRLGLAVRLENAAAVALFRGLGFRREIAVARWLKREG
ncbi:MAG: family acetyltransferase [Firmicutes bacterium]|nr:family acetyltransferase [Bacillota bacterium]